MKNDTGWFGPEIPDNKGNGTNESGFEGVPGGYR